MQESPQYQLALANRILFAQGVVDAFGHVSLRDPADPGRFFLSRNRAPALVTPGDIVTLNLDGTHAGDDTRASYLERFIHGGIYAARPDVLSVVHSHSPSVVPFGVVAGAPLRAVCHMCGFMGRSTPVFEIRECAGDATDLLITDRRLGAALAAKLGARPLVLMRGHGSTVVGDSLHEAVYRAVYTEVNARLQAEAMRLGPVTFLSDGEAASAETTMRTQFKRAWDHWCAQVEPQLKEEIAA